MMEYRVRSKRTDAWALERRGAMVTPDMIQLKLEGPARILKPNGKPLAVYLPGAVADLSAEMFADFSRIRLTTDNRGYAGGGRNTGRWRGEGTSARQLGNTVVSSVLGSIETSRRKMEMDRQPCRLTSFTAHQVEKWESLLPMFQRISELFEANVPERFGAQVEQARSTHSDWVIKDTPFTTITVNNTYPTGIHTDKGDLDAGFSTLVALRRGEYTGGWLTFPQYGVAADMQDGDLLLMDAHDWHGNTPIECARCGESLRKPDHQCGDSQISPERVSIVSYFRTQMVNCKSLPEEEARRADAMNRATERAIGLVEEEVNV